MKIKKLYGKIITPVPPELKEHFDDMLLKTSIYRLRLIALFGLCVIFGNTISLLNEEEALQIKDFVISFFNIFGFISLSNIILFFALSFIFNKKTNRVLLWTACYIFIAGYYVIYSYSLYYTQSLSFFPGTIFITAFLFTIIPDFNPKVSVLFSLFYLIIIVFILFNKYKSAGEYLISSEEYYRLLSDCVNMVLMITIAKILLYNSKVKNYIGTHKINSLNNELKSYNDNLEEMVNKKTATIVELKNAVMETIADLVERRDDATGGHVSRTSGYLKIIIDEIIKKGLYSDQTALWNINQMVMSAQLHDVGKIAIDDSILRKPSKLDKDEFEKMKKHTIFGGQIIKEIQEKTSESEFLNYAYIFAVYHHERWDGLGYPHGIIGEKIPLPARLMAIIDVYDALVSERPYKKAYPHEEAIKIINEGKGSQFDPYLVKIFISLFELR